MKVKIYCPCGTTLIWSFEAVNPSVTTGIGETQPCCTAKVEQPRDNGLKKAMEGVREIPKKGRGR